MRRQFSDRKRVTVYLEADEYEWIESQAGHGRISEFMRGLVYLARKHAGQPLSEFEGDEVVITKVKRKAEPAEGVSRDDRINMLIAQDTGHALGHRCEKCDRVRRMLER